MVFACPPVSEDCKTLGCQVVTLVRSLPPLLVLRHFKNAEYAQLPAATLGLTIGACEAVWRGWRSLH